jgi:type I restriction enzyme, R subunit
LATPEQRARHNVDRMLELAGWSVQDLNALDFTVSRGVALREFPLEAGFADYKTFVTPHDTPALTLVTTAVK